MRLTPWMVLSALLWVSSTSMVHAGDNVWTSIGPAGVEIIALVIDPITPTTLYAGTGYGVFKSTNGGSNWVNTGLPPNIGVLALVLAPTTRTTLYAGTRAHSVFTITLLSSCVWGLYIDDHQSGGSWESRLFLSNIDTQHVHDYEVFVLATDTVCSRSLSLGPSGIVELTCGDLNACGVAGWLYVQSDAPVFAATLFVINTVFGGGAFTAQTPVCQFSLP